MDIIVKVKVTQLCLTLCNPIDCSRWNSPGQNTGVDSLSLLQGIFSTQAVNPGLLHCKWILYQLSHKGSPWMWQLDHVEGWTPKNWLFQIVMLEKTLESLLDCKGIKPVNPKENNPEYSLELKGCCWITQRCQDSWPPEEKSSIRGHRWGLITQSFCVRKFY